MNIFLSLSSHGDILRAYDGLNSLIIITWVTRNYAIQELSIKHSTISQQDLNKIKSSSRHPGGWP